VPLDKEIIIYKPDENHSIARIKIGDGVTGINELPFSVDEIEIPDFPEIEIPEQVQADWAQNDENSVDYVKNRTHWVEQIENYILWEGVLSESAPGVEGLQFYKVSDEILNPLNYVITIAGTDYTVNIIETTNDIIFGKDEDGILLVMAGTSEALSQLNVDIAWTEGTYIINGVSFAYGEAISIKTPSYEIVHKLDNKYIDFDFDFKTDWNQMDPANKGYIKNRTHYVSDQAFKWSGTIGVDGYIEKTGSIRYPIYTWYCTISNIPYDLMGATVSGVRRTPSGEHPFSGVIDQVSKVEGIKQYTSSQCTLPFPIESSAGGITTSLITRHGTVEYDRGSTMTITKSRPILKLDSKYLDETTVAFKTDIETVNTELETVKTDIEEVKIQIPSTPDWSQNDENGKGYVKNRTHWEEPIVYNFVISESDIDLEPIDDNVWYAYKISDEFLDVTGAVVTVRMPFSVDGEESYTGIIQEGCTMESGVKAFDSDSATEAVLVGTAQEL
jgi:hypothetical protein